MIHGNTRAEIQIRTINDNVIGEQEKKWETIETLFGWLDKMDGESRYTSYDSKIQESTHVFLADYRGLDKRIKAENSRVVIAGYVYDIMLIDDPMEMHRQLEIYLKYTGGQ